MINERYLIKKKLGEGRSQVFLCNDIENPSEDIAIKILPGNADEIETKTFHDEFITLRRLKHPNIIQALDYGTIVKTNLQEYETFIGNKYSCLEYFDGKLLLDYDEINDEEILKSIITQICSVLFYLHQSNYIYYDLKPENILVKKINGIPHVKLLDLGFAKNLLLEQIEPESNKSIKGTAEYIAPELLRNDPHDNRVDLYSLGIILYRIVYKKFPFDTKDELKIYKAHLEKDFDFDESVFSDELINVVKKLLEKEPEKRYRNSIEILYDLNIPINNKITKDWIPAAVFSGRRDVLNILDTYTHDETSSEIFTVKGFEGSGKTALSEEIDFIYDNSVIIKYDRSKSGYQFLKSFLKKIIFNDFTYSNISSETKNNIESLLENSSSELIDELKGIFARVTQESNFTLILDDFNNYDNFTLEMIRDILPILQVNKIKIIITEDSNYDYTSNSFHNVKEINLTPFTDVQVSELIEKSYYEFFPKEELTKLILLYADLLPGSIEGFIKDCLQLDIIQYKQDEITIDVSEETSKVLKSSHDQIYEIRLSYLTDIALKAAKILSLLDVSLDENILADLMELNKNKTLLIIEELRDNNILHSLNAASKLQFTSEGLKKHIYTGIDNKKEYHLKVGNILRKKNNDFDRNELARQFELGEDYDTCYEILKDEINEAEKMAALSYKKGILNHLQTIPLNAERKFEIELELSRVLKKGNEYSNCFNLTNSLLEQEIPKTIELELLIQKGICLIALRELETGKELLLSILPRINDPGLKEETKLEIAYAYFDMNKYSEAQTLCNEILQNNLAEKKTVAKTFNLLALIEIYLNNNLNNAIKFFNNGLEIFNELKLLLEVSKIEVNIGNIYNIQGINEEAEKHWNIAIEINMSVGNILQEAYPKLNFGIYYYNNLLFEKAIEQYRRAYDIYLSLGDNNGLGLVLNNLGETYLMICEYEKCIDSLTKSTSIFEKTQNVEEKIEALFLSGKFYFTFDYHEKLKLIVDECSDIEKKNTLGSKYKNYISFIKQLYSIKNDNVDACIERLKEIADNFFKVEDITNFAKIHLLIAENLISIDKYDAAIKTTTDENLIKTCSEEKFLEAERLYLLGKIQDKSTLQIEESSIELLEKSFNIIKDENITELTWKVLLELAEYYSGRGNYTKANDYIIYTQSVISYIVEKIGDMELRKVYLMSKNINDALKRLEYLEIQTEE